MGAQVPLFAPPCSPGAEPARKESILREEEGSQLRAPELLGTGIAGKALPGEEAKPGEPPTISVELKYHVKTRSSKPMQVVKVQGSRTSEPFRASTVLVFPTDTSRAKAMVRTYKPGRGQSVRARCRHGRAVLVSP